MRGRNRGLAQLTLYIAVLASLAYMGGGIALIASSQSFGVFPEPGPLRYGMATLLLIYGIFRAYRAYQRFQGHD
ncbi:hypothetical protein GGR92_002865 [Spirosoma lacussanchae]|uniref:C4-dicarboxylate ABC transporter n=1 Tax=Spirosoma sordidisoli TaxID=2502893 RepID=A0A4Q2UL58_9BACT|nr:hypothetical protein EQG79_18750 [Spirosoma sordidisoli]